MQLPDGYCALYFEMPWGDVLRIYAVDAPPSERQYDHAVRADRADSVLYALGQYDDTEKKKAIYYKMVGNGLIESAS